MRSLHSYLLVNRRERARQHQQRTIQIRLGRIGLGLGASLSLLVFLAVLLGVLAYTDLTRDLPSPAAIPALLDPPNGLFLQPTRLYDRTGQHLLLTLGNAGISRRVVSIDPGQPGHIPQVVISVTLATTDPGFWNHPGFTLAELSPARLFTPAEPDTLAEHLVSDLLLNNEPKGVRRNLRQMLLAAQLTSQYGREQILAWYLNSAYYGHQAYGIDEASQLYLGKPASSLDLAEAALLAGVAEAPALNPLDAPDAAQAQQRRVLEQLSESGLFPADQVKQALDTPLKFRQASAADSSQSSFALAFTHVVIQELSSSLGQERVERGGLVVTTTLDYALQQQLACTAQFFLKRVENQSGQAVTPDTQACPAAGLLPTQYLDQSHEISDAAVSGAIVDPQNGEVLAYLGDQTTEGETATQETHPSGTLLTPFIYLAGFTRGDGPATLVWDIPSSLPSIASDEPNPDGKFHGPVRMRLALANDYLAPAAQLLAQIGPENVWAQAQSFGLPSMVGEPLPYSGGELTPLEAAQAYSVFASGGVLNTTHTVLHVEGEQTPSLQPGGLTPVRPGPRSILSAPLAYLMNQVLSDESARWPSLGLSNPLEIGRLVGAKLGQTVEGQSTWSVGYTPQRVVAIWVGSQKLQPEAAGSGSSQSPIDPRLAASFWHALIQYSSRDLPVTGWNMPPGVTQVTVCDPSGLLPTPACPNQVNEVFLSENVPNTADNLYQSFEVNRETGRLATVFTPVDKVEDRIYLVVPAEARDWAESTGLPVPPALYDAIQAPAPLPDVNMTSPALFSTVHGQVTIQGTAGGSDFSSYQLEIGQGINPKDWIMIGKRSTTPVNDGTLGAWDTRQQGDGLYAVRLMVVHQNQQVNTAVIQVTVDNTPPVVSILYPTRLQTLPYTSNFSLVLKAQASDAVGIDHVEWWVDGKEIGSLSQEPFNFPWQEKTGNHQLVVKAYDRAGNLAVSTPVPFVIAK